LFLVGLMMVAVIALFQPGTALRRWQHACHRPGSGGPIETPILSEQGQEYIALQLKMYATGERRNDVYGRMRTIASKLTQTEIDGLAKYYRAGFR
jgi:cytochrome c553